MKKTKYGKQLIRGPFYFGRESYDGISIYSHHDEYKAGVTLGYHCLNSTNFAAMNPHSHDFHELLCFFGGDPTNINKFDAEISICLGDELEEHIITSPTVVSIPPGLKHCPLIVKRCDSPVVFLEISTTKDYQQNRPGAKPEEAATPD
jgi:hypothetical protein